MIRRIRVLLVLLALAGLGSACRGQERGQPQGLELATQTKCLQVLRDGLASDEFWPSMHAAEALTIASLNEEVIAAVKPRIESEVDHQRRCGLAREVVRAGDEAPLDVLYQTLGDEQSNGRVHAAESLYKVNKPRDGKLLRKAFEQTSNLRLRLMAAAALSRAGDEPALRAVRDTLSHEDVEIRKVAAWVLTLLGDQSDLQPLTRMMKRETDPLAQAYATNAAACLGDATAREWLGKNLRSKDAPVRAYSAEFTGYSRSIEHRARLIEMLDDEVLDTRVRAAQALLMLSMSAKSIGLPRNLIQNLPR